MAILYYAYFHRRNEAFYKIGVTLSTIRARLSAFQALGYTYRVLKEKRSTLRRMLATEQLLIEKHTRKYQYTPRRKDKHGRPAGGHKECFSRPLTPKLLVESGIA